MEENYYAEGLNSGKLYRVYETRLPRVRQYLDAEIDFVRRKLSGSERVLELGAGYGRILKELAPHVERILGIDIAEDNVAFGREYLKDIPRAELIVMDAHHPELDEKFDVVLALQNALSAVKGEAQNLVEQSVRLLKAGGVAYFSTYSPKFWVDRLAWFEEQADKGLLGKIDRELTLDGVIVCKDGFRARTFPQEELEALGRAAGYHFSIEEVDESSLFLMIEKSSAGD